MPWNRSFEIYIWVSRPSDSGNVEDEEAGHIHINGDMNGKEAHAKLTAFNDKLKAAIDRYGDAVWIQTNGMTIAELFEWMKREADRNLS